MPNTLREAVRVINLTWTPYASSRPLLKNISFSVRAGERVLLVGPSGSGKSTLLRAIAGVLVETESGELDGVVEARRSGLLLQDPNDSIVSDTIFREVAFGLENQGVPRDEMEALVAKKLSSVALSKRLSHPSMDLSGGEMQRMAFAGVTVMNPDLILLDEPTSMLDQTSAGAVRASVAEVLDECNSTLIVVEHRFEAWLPQVTRMLVLNRDGELMLDGEPREILAKHAPILLELGLWLPGQNAPEPKKIQLGDVGNGQLTVLTGNSGAGKTTELKRRLTSDPHSQTIVHGVGYVPQQAELTIIGNTVFQSASLTAKLAARGLGFDVSEAIGHTEQLLTDLGVAKLAEANPYEISGGEQRRVAIATALAHRPAALYLDEPTVGQDREAWSAIVGAILSAREAGVNITLATHDSELIAYANEVVEILPEAHSPEPGATPLVSGLAIFAAPLVLLLGSLAITTVARGAFTLLAAGAAALVIAFFGFRFTNAKLLIPGLVGIVSIGLSNWYLSPGLDLATGLVAGMRLTLFVLPGILLAASLRPIALGDQLGQSLRLPARPVVAAVAAMQRLDGLIALWGELRFIHSIRGLGAGRTPWSRFLEFSRLIFALLVQAIRGAGTTAVAMDSRGFSSQPLDGSTSRTWAELPKRGKLDYLVLGLAIIVALAPLFVR